MLDKMDERRIWKGDDTDLGRAQYRTLNNELSRETNRARDDWWTEQCLEIEEFDRRGRPDLMYARIKQITSGRNKSGQNDGIEDNSGKLLTDGIEIRERWKEHIEELYSKDNKPTWEEMNVENEKLVEIDNVGPAILESEIIEAINRMKINKAEGIDGIPAEFWKVLEEKGMRELVNLCHTIYNNGKWPDEFSKTIVVPLPKKENAVKCSDFRTISLIPHVSKIMLRVLTQRINGKAESYLSDSQFGFRKGVGTRDAIGTMRMLIQRSLECDKDVYVCFVDFEKAFDRVNWPKMMSVLKEIGVDWRDRRLIADLYLKQEMVVRVDGSNSEPGVVGRGVRQGCLMSPVLFSVYVESMMKEAMDGMRAGVKVGGKWVRDIRFADDQGMMAGTQKGLQKIMDALQRTAQVYGMKINVKKTKTMRISRNGGEIVDIYIEGQKVEQVKKFKYLGAWITEDGRCEVEIRTRIALAKDAFTKKKELLSRKMDLITRKRIVKTVIWSVLLYGAETWSLRQEDVQRLEAFEMWIWRRMQKVSYTEHKTNEEVLNLVGEKRVLIETIIRRKKNWIGHVLRGEGMMKEIIEGKFNGRKGRGRNRIGMLDHLKEGGTYVDMKRKADDRELWRNWTPRTCRLAEH